MKSLLSSDADGQFGRLRILRDHGVGVIHPRRQDGRHARGEPGQGVRGVPPEKRTRHVHAVVPLQRLLHRTHREVRGRAL